MTDLLPPDFSRLMQATMKAYSCGLSEAANRVHDHGVSFQGLDWTFALMVTKDTLVALITPERFLRERGGYAIGDIRPFLPLTRWVFDKKLHGMRWTGRANDVDGARADLRAVGLREDWRLHDALAARRAPGLVPPADPRPAPPEPPATPNAV